MLNCLRIGKIVFIFVETLKLKQMKQTFLTVPEFARKHGVSPQAIRYQIKLGYIDPIMKFGVILIDSKTRYKPRSK